MEKKMKKKITKTDIENLANKIIKTLEKKGLANDLCVYFNNKRICVIEKYNRGEVTFEEKLEENINPHKYFEYCAYEHIISISTEGELYDVLNYGSGTFPNELEKLFQKMGIYWELGNSWNLSFYPIYEEMEIEYTRYSKPIATQCLTLCQKEKVPPTILPIMEKWYEKARLTGDKGSCVIGAYFSFIFEDKPYEMAPCSPWQGEFSWANHIDWVKAQLKEIGATNIVWHYGYLD